MHIAVVKGSIRDCASYAELETSSGYDAYIEPYSTQEHLAERCKPGVLYLNIIDTQSDGQLGFACLVYSAARQTVELRRIVVKTPNQGIGQLAMVAIEDYVITYLPATRLWLDVLVDNSRAISVYHKAGFQPVESRVTPLGEVFIFEKQIGVQNQCHHG
ncbi:hypothetical protein NBRC116494_11860 [Aurantivibrio plasticivorans]